MDESYNDGQAIYRLAQAYQGKGDTENAKTWYQKMVDCNSEWRCQCRYKFRYKCR